MTPLQADLPEAFGMKALADVSVSNQGKVRAVVATFDEVDNDREVLLSGSIADGMKITGSAYNHDTVMAQLLGRGTPDSPPVSKGVIRIEGSKAVAYLDYFMETQRGREAFLTVKAMGPDQPWSFSFRIDKVDKPSPEWKAKGAVRMLSKLGPLLDGAMEVSPVKMPGGKFTGTLSAKAAEQSTPSSPALIVLEPRPEYLEKNQWVGTSSQFRVVRRAWLAGLKAAGLRSDPTLRWFHYTPEAGCAGQYLPPPRDEIWIARDLSPEETLITCLHELKHAAQWQDGDPVVRQGITDAWAEGECNGFAAYEARKLIRDGILE